MLRLTLAQMRRSLGRLAAAGVAIAIGTAFVAATLLAGNAITRTTYDAVTSDLGDADLIVVPGDGALDDAAVEAVRTTDGVDVVDPYQETWVDLSGPTGQTYVGARAPTSDPRLETAVLESGVLPGRRGVALPATIAASVGADVGDTVQITRSVWTESDDGAEMVPDVDTIDLTVTGITDDGQAALLGRPMIHLPAEMLSAWAAEDPPAAYPYLLVLADAGMPVEVLKQELAATLATVDPPARPAVRTTDEQAALITAQLTGSTTALTGLVLGFAAVALLVAALVITNTFQVIVAQRTRTLALLRCVGAVRGQLRRSVLTEALLLGLTSSVVGLLAGTGLVQLALSVLNARGTDVPLPTSVTVTAASVLVPLLCGTAVTVLASWSPARSATRVSPLAALTPAGPPPIGQRSGRLRAAFSVLLILVGAGGLVLGTVAARESDVTVGVGIGVLGGAVSFVGVLVGAVYWVPGLVARTGRVLDRAGSPTVALAAANSVRNPRRTASTSAALFIGVTLVAMMATGAAGARVALDAGLQEQFPVDVEVNTMDLGDQVQAMPPTVVDDVRSTDGVAAVVELTGARVEVMRDGQTLTSTRVHALEPDRADSVMLAPRHVADLADGVVVVPQMTARFSEIESGQRLTLSTGTTTVDLRAVVSEMPGWDPVVTPATMALIDPAAPVDQLWVRLTGVGEANRVVSEITAIASSSGQSLSVLGSAVDRAFYDRVVNTLLAVVVGLLAVAVVIAVVGVANTLSLSVIERRRESAMLRAIGLSRRQLRGMLAIEGTLIAGVGAAVGVVLGLVYGWLGVRTTLGEFAPVGLTVPWGQLTAVLGVALLAGLLASVLPGRNAARTSPVEALAE